MKLRSQAFILKNYKHDGRCLKALNYDKMKPSNDTYLTPSEMFISNNTFLKGHIQGQYVLVNQTAFCQPLKESQT